MSTREPAERSRTLLMVVAWLWVGVPFAYGLWQLLIKLPALFGN